MKLFLLAALSAVLCFSTFGSAQGRLPSASPTVASAAVGTTNAALSAQSTAEAWPGGNRKARRITKRARKRTNGITQFAAFKVMKRRKAKRKKFKRAAQQGFHRADKSAAPRKKVGCNN